MRKPEINWVIALFWELVIRQKVMSVPRVT